MTPTSQKCITASFIASRKFNYASEALLQSVVSRELDSGGKVGGAKEGISPPEGECGESY